jgi:TonB dependent receptor-like, beta-barrel
LELTTFFSSGQIPLDLVSEGRLPRFGVIDPNDGGNVRLGTGGVYYRKAFLSGDTFKADGFLSRSLFDLFSNFTFFLNDTENGDGIQQHDSRLQEGFNAQYEHPYRLLGMKSLLTTGTNVHANQINVGLFPQRARRPLGVTTSAVATVNNTAGYAEQGMDFLEGRLHVQSGLRWDYFRFGVDEQSQAASRLQPKVGLAFRLSNVVPLTLSFNYGRGINTQDARGIVSRPESPRIATTDFHQIGASYQAGRLSLSTDVFLIDHSNEQVYIPDDGTLELKGPSRSYGYEGKTAVRITRFISLDGGITQVMNSFYRATSPRVYVDSAPHTVANAGLTFSGWRRTYTSLRYRHISNYRLDGTDPSIRASGLDVVDVAITQSLRPAIDLNVDIDNLTGKVYYETQNYFESRVAPTAAPVKRIHGTPGYPFGLTVGLTFHLGSK